MPDLKEAPMSSLSLTNFSGIATVVTGHIVELPIRIFNSSLRKYAARKALSDMMALDDRMLADIGLFRSEIASIVAHRCADATRIPR
jgi:uncharacterized protein YjiS (DUF1127 family)